jgi:hypothetical protein
MNCHPSLRKDNQRLTARSRPQNLPRKSIWADDGQTLGVKCTGRYRVAAPHTPKAGFHGDDARYDARDEHGKIDCWHRQPHSPRWDFLLECLTAPMSDVSGRPRGGKEAGRKVRLGERGVWEGTWTSLYDMASIASGFRILALVVKLLLPIGSQVPIGEHLWAIAGWSTGEAGWSRSPRVDATERSGPCSCSSGRTIKCVLTLDEIVTRVAGPMPRLCWAHM